jgi:hypothetical protein
MNLLTSKPLARRTILRGVGATLALPFLEAMVPSARGQAAAMPVHRFQTFYVPNGMAMEFWTPKGEGSAFELSPIMEPLAPFRDQMLVLSGLKANWNYIHAGASGSFLTGTTRGGRTKSRSSPMSRWISCWRAGSPGTRRWHRWSCRSTPRPTPARAPAI